MNAAAAMPACFHCGQAIAGSVRYYARIGDRQQPMCCPACQAVAETINGSGLDNYYRFRTQASTTAIPTDAFEVYDRSDVQAGWLKPLSDGVVEGEWLIAGMHCAACVWLLENHLRRLPGVSAVQVNLAEQRATVAWRPAQQRASDIAGAIAAIGYQPQSYSIDAAEQLRRREQRQTLRQLGVAGFGMMQVGMCALTLYAGAAHGIEPIYQELLRWTSLVLSIPVVLYSGQPFFAGAWRGLRRGSPGMDVPVALAIALAFAASVWTTLQGSGDIYFDSVTMFIFLLLAGRYLEMRARHYNGRLSSDLFSLLPRTAARVDDTGQVQRIPSTALRIGDTVLVGDGQIIPADGELLDARASISEAAITGEFLAVEKLRGQSLCAGTVNGSQPISLRVTAIGQDLQLAAIHALSRRALADKPHIAQLADRWAVGFVAIILLLASGTAALWAWLDPARALGITLSVLAVSCPCALGLATPFAIANATQALRRRGLLVTRAAVWEKLPAITDVVFDKTGTLTLGAMGVLTVLPLRQRSAYVYLNIAAALETGSSHPIAQAFAQPGMAAAGERIFSVGHGVEGTIAGRRYRLGKPEFALPASAQTVTAPTGTGLWILLADDSEPLCWFQLGDPLREEAAATVAALQQRGLQVHVLSGDTDMAVSTLAARLHIAHSVGGASPEKKMQYIAALQRGGRRVLMVGDGINDLPVLAAADVSIAMNNASELAKTCADGILLAPRLDRLPQLLQAAAFTRRIIRENLGWALAYNAAALPLAMAGLVPPWLAAIGMSASSLLVVGNALRLQWAWRA